MGTKTLTSVVGGEGIHLAPDLTYPKDKSGLNLYDIVTGLDATAGNVTILSLTGRWEIKIMFVSQLTANDVGLYKLTVDGVVIWNVDPLAQPVQDHLIGQDAAADKGLLDSVICEESFLFEMSTDTDADFRLNYFARPIL